MYRITGRRSDAVAGVRRRERCQHRLAEVVLAAPDHRRQRFLDVVYPWGLSLPFSIAGRDDIRLAALDGEFIHAADDAPHGVVRQRPHRLQIVPLLDFLLGVEDGRARQAPVDDFRRAAPRLQSAAFHGFAVPWSVGRFRPHDGLAVTAGNQNEPLTAGRCAVVSRHQLTPFDRVAEIPKLADELSERRACQLLYRLALSDRPPRLELFDIFEEDHSRPHQSGPSQGDPRKAADFLVNESCALSLAEMLAVGREPRTAHGTPAAYVTRVNIPNGRLIMLRVRVVRLVHQDCCRVVIDGRCHRNAEADLHARRCAATAREAVNEDFVVDADLCAISHIFHSSSCG